MKKEEKYYTIRPNGIFRRVWDLIMAITVFGNLLLIPFQVAFEYESIILDVITWIMDAYFLIDIGLNFFTGYTDDGVEVCCKFG